MMWALVASLLFATSAASQLVPVQVQAPEYPEVAVKAQMTGTVKVSVAVAPDGSVTSADAGGKPNPLLAAVSEAAAREWRFEPNLDRAETTIILTFEFAVKVDQPAKSECFVGPSRVTVVLPSTVRILGWSRPPPRTVNYGNR
jgi:TonB family protein